jgi:predicted amidohydrolase YtcJ
VDGIKLYMDGALGSRGAALLAPYSDAPGSTGLLLTPADVIAKALVQARKVHAQVAIHAIGDRGNAELLDIFADVIQKNGPPADLRAHDVTPGY